MNKDLYKQQTLFSENTIQNINIYHAAPQNESLGSDGILAKFTPTQMEALKNIMREHNIKGSTFLREAMDFYIELFPFKNKIQKHKNFLIETLKRLA